MCISEFFVVPQGTIFFSKIPFTLGSDKLFKMKRPARQPHCFSSGPHAVIIFGFFFSSPMVM